MRYINTRQETIIVSSIGNFEKKNSAKDWQIKDMTVQKNGIDEEIKQSLT